MTKGEFIRTAFTRPLGKCITTGYVCKSFYPRPSVCFGGLLATGTALIEEIPPKKCLISNES